MLATSKKVIEGGRVRLLTKKEFVIGILLVHSLIVNAVLIAHIWGGMSIEEAIYKVGFCGTLFAALYSLFMSVLYVLFTKDNK